MNAFLLRPLVNSSGLRATDRRKRSAWTANGGGLRDKIVVGASPLLSTNTGKMTLIDRVTYGTTTAAHTPSGTPSTTERDETDQLP